MDCGLLDSERPALELRCCKVSLDVSRRRRFSCDLSSSETVGVVLTEDAEVLVRFGGTRFVASCAAPLDLHVHLEDTEASTDRVI